MCIVAALARRNNGYGIICSNNTQCLVNLASLMAVEFGAGELG